MVKRKDDGSIVESTLKPVPLNLQRNKPKKHDDDELPPASPPPVSYPMEKIAEYALNPTREKIREVTVIDKLQARIFPILDVCNYMMANLIEVATFRESPDNYKVVYLQNKPKPINASDEYLYRIAQWNKSIGGKTFMEAMGLAVIEKENTNDEDNFGGNADVWGKD